MVSSLSLQATPSGRFHVSYTKRPAGRRELIARGDEATVTRLVGGGYDGMVERLQHSNQGHSKDPFYPFYERANDGQLPIPGHRPETFVIRFFHLAFSKLIFPDNFINVTEMKLQKTTSGLLAAAYSDYVQTSEDAIQRRRQHYHQYYAPAGKEFHDNLPPVQTEIAIQKLRRDSRKISNDEKSAKMQLRYSIDHQEFVKEPGLLLKTEETLKAGILISHPSMNYGLDHNGNIVFFEVDSISLNQAVVAANNSTQRNEAIGLLAMSLAVALKGAAHMDREELLRNDWYSEYRNIEVQDLYEAALYLLMMENRGEYIPTIIKDPHKPDWNGTTCPISFMEWSRHVREKSRLDIGQFPRFSIDQQIFATS